jgi:DNA-binding transcriptional ArsR family regulator
MYNHMVVNHVDQALVDQAQVDQAQVDQAQVDQAQVDQMFHALADATRRDIVTRVLRVESSVSALACHYTMSFAAVQKHVAVLERAHIVTKERRGREQIVRVNIDAVRRASVVLDRFESIWRSRMDRFGEILAEPQHPTSEQHIHKRLRKGDNA